jgi:hypothetical protein
VKALKTYKIELLKLKLKLQVSEANSERWKRKYDGMSDRIYGPVEDSSRNSSRKSVKIAATPIKNGRAWQCSEGVLPPSMIVGTSTTVIGY